MRILGVDPGLGSVGYGLIESNGVHPAPGPFLGKGSGAVLSERLLEAGLIRTKPSHPLPDRLAIIARELRAILAQHRPDCVAVEDLYSHYKTPKPAILMGHVRGIVLEIAAWAKIPVESYLPTRVKKAVVGRGHAPKEQIARMVEKRLGLNSGPVPADVTDALAVALCHMDRVRRG